jgi:hypothetical protein
MVISIMIKKLVTTNLTRPHWILCGQSYVVGLLPNQMVVVRIQPSPTSPIFGPSPTVQPFYFYFLSILISYTGQAQHFRIITIGLWPFCCPFRVVLFSGFRNIKCATPLLFGPRPFQSSGIFRSNSTFGHFNYEFSILQN